MGKGKPTKHDNKKARSAVSKLLATKVIAKRKPKALKQAKRKACPPVAALGSKDGPKKGSQRYEESKEYLVALNDAANARLELQPNPLKLDRPTVKGYDLNQGVNYSKIFSTLWHTGFQATNLGRAIEKVNQMIKWRLSDEPVTAATPAHLRDPKVRANTRCTIFLGYTSNMSSCGMRDYIRYLCQHKMVDAIVTTCGGIEEDFMKCMAPFYMGEFTLKGKDLHQQGINRTGNLLVPMHNYHLFDEWAMPIFQQMHKEQKENGQIWSPSKIIQRLGKEINNEESVYYWCYKNNIPVFSPAITDGQVGDLVFDHVYDGGEGFVIDVVQDIVKLNEIALKSQKTGMLILGGGVVKHHICNAQIRRGGADFTVYVNTAVEMDGSDAGAAPDEAVSWGKISEKCDPVKVWTEATLVFPILVGETFAKHFDLAKRV